MLIILQEIALLWKFPQIIGIRKNFMDNNTIVKFIKSNLDTLQ